MLTLKLWLSPKTEKPLDRLEGQYGSKKQTGQHGYDIKKMMSLARMEESVQK